MNTSSTKHFAIIAGAAFTLAVAVSIVIAFAFPLAARASEAHDLAAGTIAAQSDTQDAALGTQAQGPTKKCTWKRIWGREALDTMKAIVDEGGFVSGGTVVLATHNGYWDALTANGVAGFAGAPVVMTEPDRLSPQAKQVLARLKPTKIIVCGGTLAISDQVERDAAATTGVMTETKRLWGQEADDTAVDIFKNGYAAATGDTSKTGWSDTAFICTDGGYWDALSTAPISYAKHMPILLTRNNGSELSTSTLDALKDGGIKYAYIIGGELAVKPNVKHQLEAAGINVKDRIWGQQAVDTSARVAEFGTTLGLTADSMGVATTGGYWDALAGAAFCGKKNSVIILVDGPYAPPILEFQRPRADSMTHGYVFGGVMAVSTGSYSALLGGSGLDAALGMSRADYIASIERNWTSGSHYQDTWYEGWNYPYVLYPDWHNGMFWAKGAPSPTGHVGMNCGGFVARTIYDAGTDNGNSGFMADWWNGVDGNATGHYANARSFWRVAKNHWRQIYTFNNKRDLLNSGKAAKGDIIVMIDDWDNGGFDDNGTWHPHANDCHIGIFWGNSSNDDKFLHTIDRIGSCQMTGIMPVCWGSTYYLVKFDY